MNLQIGPISQLCGDMHRSQQRLQKLHALARADSKKASFDGMVASQINIARIVHEQSLASHSRELIGFKPANDADFKAVGLTDQIEYRR